MTRLADELTRSSAVLTLAEDGGARAAVFIEEVRDDGSMSLELDAIPDGVALRPGTAVIVECPVPGACYRIVTTITRIAPTLAARFSLRTAVPRELSRLQRRAFFRARTAVTARLRVASGDADAPWAAATVLDLSAGGAALGCSAPVEVAAQVELVLDLPDGPPLETTAVVLRVDPQRTTRDAARVVVRFADLPAPLEDRLVRFAIRVEQRRSVVPPPADPAGRRR